MARSDLHHLLVNTSRRRWSGGQPRIADGDLLVERGPMRNQRNSIPEDRLNPFYRYLRAQVGRPFAKVFAELAATYDRRSLRGFHLFQHLPDIVARRVERRRHGYWRLDHDLGPRRLRSNELFVDDRGILRQPRTDHLAAHTTKAQRRAVRETAATARDRAVRQFGTNIHILVDGLWWLVVPRPDSGAIFGTENPTNLVALFCPEHLAFHWTTAAATLTPNTLNQSTPNYCTRNYCTMIPSAMVHGRDWCSVQSRRQLARKHIDSPRRSPALRHNNR